jgi:hypothetical protein
MKETRVKKYSNYRKSILKGDSKSFLALSKSEEVSPEMGLFLKLQRKKNIENIVILSLIFSVILVLLIFGFILF